MLPPGGLGNLIFMGTMSLLRAIFSDAWAFFSTLMPESDDVKIRPLDSVVHEVPYARKVETANVLVPGVLD
jgi:hypothetical protein